MTRREANNLALHENQHAPPVSFTLRSNERFHIIQKCTARSLIHKDDSIQEGPLGLPLITIKRKFALILPSIEEAFDEDGSKPQIAEGAKAKLEKPEREPKPREGPSKKRHPAEREPPRRKRYLQEGFGQQLRV
ncbi:uncharacterized protein ATC70_009038 [Mucor velutinosus]|uniref:Uncharacterized protein n=1 Tax=Mucor velutinosus TaxID=708070 RepID=A0AAN7DMP3_9FUNG|nr:hypothetical protein ATC70_009038 [Mucor velutinosus]